LWLSTPPGFQEKGNGIKASRRRQAEETGTEETGTEEGREKMSLVPVDKHTGRKRPLNENERTRLRREKEKSDWHTRNPSSKWKSRR
jgi:hypothetical protein